MYLGVTLDWTFSYREHLSRCAAKLKSSNNLITKLAGTSCAAITSRGVHGNGEDWDSHGNGSKISHGMGMGIKCMGMGVKT